MGNCCSDPATLQSPDVKVPRSDFPDGPPPIPGKIIYNQSHIHMPQAPHIHAPAIPAMPNAAMYPPPQVSIPYQETAQAHLSTESFSTITSGASFNTNATELSNMKASKKGKGGIWKGYYEQGG